MPRFRFTVRRMMVAVAIVGLLLATAAGTHRRRGRFLALAARHEAASSVVGYGRAGMPTCWCDASGKVVSEEWVNWQTTMYLKYEHAARFPWLPVAPDPPAPK